MIRFGAIVSVVAVAIGLLVAGAASGKLLLVYVSIGLAALALLMLVVGVAVWRDRVFGGEAAPTPIARPDPHPAGAAWPDTDRRPTQAAQAEAAPAELGGFAESRTAEPRAGRRAPGAVAARGGRLPAGDTDDWTADAGPWNRDKPEQSARERAARPPAPAGRPAAADRPAPAGQPTPQGRPVPQGRPAPQGQPAPQSQPGQPPTRPAPQGQPTRPAQSAPQAQPTRAQEPQGQPTPAHAPQGQPTRPPVPQGTAARPSVPPDQPVWEPAGAGKPAGSGEAAGSKPEPQRPEPTPAAAPDVGTDVGPADDPTRLARRLGTAAELSRQPGPSTEQSPRRGTSSNPRSADPLTGPPPATSGAAGRTRLQKEAAAAAAAKAPVPSPSGADMQAKAASAESKEDAGPGETVAGSTSTGLAEQQTVGRGAVGNRTAAGAEVGTDEVAGAVEDSANGTIAEEASPEVASAKEAVAAAEPTTAEPTSAGPTTAGPTAPEPTAPEPTTSEPTNAEAGDPASGDTTPEAAGLVSVVPGIARYHLPDCILIRFLSAEDLETMTRQAAETAGFVPCRACRPEKATSDD